MCLLLSLSFGIDPLNHQRMYPSSTSAMDACFVKSETQTGKKKEYYYSDSDAFDSKISTFRTSKSSDHYLEEHHIGRDVSGALEKSDTEDEVFSDHEQLVLFPLRPPPRLQNALYSTSSSSPSHRPASARYGLSLGFGLIKSKKNKDFDPFMAALERVQKEAEESEKERFLPSCRTRPFSSSFRLIIPEPTKVVPEIKAIKEDDCSLYYWDEFRIEVGVGDDREICSFSDGEARPLKPPPPRLQPAANLGRSKSSSFRHYYSGRFLGKINYSRSKVETQVEDPFAVALERVRTEAGEKNDPAPSSSTASARTGFVRRARSFRWGTEPAASNAASDRKKKEMGSVIDQSPVNGGSASIYCTWHGGSRGSGADLERRRSHKRKDVGRRGFGYLLIQFHGFLR